MNSEALSLRYTVSFGQDSFPLNALILRTEFRKDKKNILKLQMNKHLYNFKILFMKGMREDYKSHGKRHDLVKN